MAVCGETTARERRGGLLGLVAVACVFLVHAWWLEVVAEDAFIIFRFAQNWVAGHGLVWNPGEAPVEGFTTFLWLVICSLALRLGLDLPIVSQVLGLLAGLASLEITRRCGLLLGLGAVRSLLAPLALALSGPFAAWAVAGMETSLFGMLVVASVYTCARYAKSARREDLHATLALLLAAALTRPEGVMVAGCLVLAAPAAFGRKAWRGLGPWPVLYTGVYAAYFAWRWSYFGYPLPNTFYAKTGGGLEQALRGANYVGLFGLHYGLAWVPALVLAGLPALPRLERLRERPLVPLAAAVSLPYVLYVVVVGGDYMAMYRFLVPVLPLLYLLLVGACTRGSTGRSPTLMRAALALGLAGGLVHSTPLESRWVRDQPLMHGNYRGVEKERWYVQRHEAIGRFFARYAEPQESIATSAIGAVAYFSGLRVFDVHGIVDPHIAHSGSSPGQIGTGLPGHEKTDFPYLFSRKPTFYIFNRSLFPKPFPGLPHLTASVDGVVRRDYQVGSVWLEDEANSESGYFAFLQRRDRNSVATGIASRPE